MILNYIHTVCPTKTDVTPVVLIHGLFGSLENLNIIAKAVSEHYDVINVDLRNHGQSAHDATHTYPNMAQDVIDTLASIDIHQAYIIGHSMGGKVAMQLAQMAPNLAKKLVILDIAPVSYHSRHDKIIAALGAVQDSSIHSRNDADTIMKQYIDELGVRQFLLKSLYKNEQGQFTWRFNLSAITRQYDQIINNIDANDSCLCETLFIKGSQSDYILAEHRDQIAKLFPNSKGKVIHGAGHWLHAEKPVAVNKSILDFLQ